MKIIFPWPSSAIRFFLKKKKLLLAYRCHSPQCTWVMIFSTKDGGAANPIRNGDWMQDQMLKDDLSRKVRQNWKKSEILEQKYPMYAWRERTLARRPARRLQYFDISSRIMQWILKMRNGTCIIPQLQSANHLPAKCEQ